MRLEINDNCCATARRLIAQGLDGAEILEFCRGDVVCLRGRADAFAKFQVRENENTGPIFVRWRDRLGSFLKGAEQHGVEGNGGLEPSDPTHAT